MNLEKGRFIGIGVAHVDYVFSDTTVETYPTTREQVLPFIESHKPNLIRAGSPMPNTFTAIHLLTERRLKLFHCVGADERGDFFRRETSPGIGLAQVDPTEPTGVWIGFNDEKGSLRFGLSCYGAALKVKITNDELAEENNNIFVTDVSSCKHEEIHTETESILRQLNKDGGIFAFSLGGARPSSLDHARLTSVVNSLRFEPQVVFSNATEFKYFTGLEDIKQALSSHFTNTRLLVVTLGREGSVIRFEDRLIMIHAYSVGNIKDEVGAGDAYMGTMLTQLFNYPYRLWNYDLVKKAGQIAAFAASQVVTSSAVRLTIEQAQAVLDYSQRMKVSD